MNEALVAGLAIGDLAAIVWFARTARHAATNGNRAPEHYRLTYTVTWPEPPAWAAHPLAEQIVELPTWWLRSIADPGELAIAATHDYRIDWLTPSIRTDGIRMPLAVNIDQTGRVCIGDGYHRLVVADRLDIDHCPVLIKTVPRIGGYGVPAAPRIAALLRNEVTDEPCRLSG